MVKIDFERNSISYIPESFLLLVRKLRILKVFGGQYFANLYGHRHPSVEKVVSSDCTDLLVLGVFVEMIEEICKLNQRKCMGVCRL